VIDSGVFGSNETIFICVSFGVSCPKESTALQVCHSEVLSEESIKSPSLSGEGWGKVSCAFHVQTTSHVSTTFHVVVQQSSALLGQEHPPHHHTYFTVSTIFSLYDDVTEKYFKADSSNPGEKSITLSIIIQQ
jgi:hypothetical protein